MTDITNEPRSADHLSSADAIQALTRFLHALHYRRKWVLMVTAIVFAGGIFYFMTVPRTYEATAQLLIDESQLRSSHMGHDITTQRAKLPTYERLITSDTVLKSALEKVRADSPECLVDLSGAEDTWIPRLRKLTAARTARNTNIIELTYRSRTSEAAEAVLIAIVDSFLEFVKKLHQDNSIEALEVLNAERRALETQITESQARLVRLRTAVGAVGYDERLSDSHPDVQTALKLNETLTETRKKRVELQAQLAAVQAAVREGKDLREHLFAIDPQAAQSLVANALGLNPQTAQRVAVEEQKLMEDLGKLQTISQHLGPTHPQRVDLEASIRTRQEFLSQHQQNINQKLTSIQKEQLGPILLNAVNEKLAKAERHEKALLAEYEIAERKVTAMNGNLSELMLVQRNLERFNRSYDTLVEKIQGIDLGHNQADVRVSAVGQPKAGRWPVAPRVLVVVAVCSLLSLVGGCGLVFLMDSIDDRFRTPDELERQAQAPVLTVVRKLNSFEGAGVMALQVHREPRASNTEAFRTLRTALTIADPDRQCIAVSSAEPGDGKTTVSSNLGAAMAQSGRRTLMIDADLRKPGLTKLFDLRQAPGLTTLLREANPTQAVDRFLIRTELENLHVIPCGPKPVDPAVVLSGPAFTELVSWAVQNYDQVLIDCPPMLVANDAAIVSRLTEGLILVVQPQKNSRRLVLRAVDRIRSVNSKLVGLVVNFAATGSEDAYYGYSENYGYGYGYGYGHDSDQSLSQESSEEEGSPANAPVISPPHEPSLALNADSKQQSRIPVVIRRRAA